MPKTLNLPDSYYAEGDRILRSLQLTGKDSMDVEFRPEHLHIFTHGPAFGQLDQRFIFQGPYVLIADHRDSLRLVRSVANNVGILGPHIGVDRYLVDLLGAIKFQKMQIDLESPHHYIKYPIAMERLINKVVCVSVRHILLSFAEQGNACSFISTANLTLADDEFGDTAIWFAKFVAALEEHVK